MVKKNFYEGNQLFPDYLIKRENPSQGEFEKCFSSEIKMFDEIICKSFEMLKSEETNRPPHYRNRNWASNIMNSNIQGMLFDNFGENVKYINGRFYLKLYGKLLSFKKLDVTSLRPFHVETATSKRLVNQYALSFEEPNPIIWIGYCVDKSWSNLIGTYAVSIDGDRQKWIVDLSNRNSETTYTIINHKENKETTETLVTVKSIAKKVQ